MTKLKYLKITVNNKKALKHIKDTKKAIKLVEEFLVKEKFEEQIKKIMFESMLHWIPWEETQAYKRMIKKYSKRK